MRNSKKQSRFYDEDILNSIGLLDYLVLRKIDEDYAFACSIVNKHLEKDIFSDNWYDDLIGELAQEFGTWEI